MENFIKEVCLKCGIIIDENTSYYDKCDDCALKLGLSLSNVK